MVALGIVWEWVKANWPRLSVAIVALLLAIVIKQCGQISAQKNAGASVSQGQNQSGSVSSTAKVRLVYIDRPGKCPDVVIDVENNASASGSQSSSSTAKADSSPKGLDLAFPIGGGYLERGFVSAGVRINGLNGEALYSFENHWGGKLSYDLKF